MFVAGLNKGEYMLRLLRSDDFWAPILQYVLSAAIIAVAIVGAACALKGAHVEFFKNSTPVESRL